MLLSAIFYTKWSSPRSSCSQFWALEPSWQLSVPQGRAMCTNTLQDLFVGRKSGWPTNSENWHWPCFLEAPFPWWLMSGGQDRTSFCDRIFANGRWMWRKTVDTNRKPIIPICWKLPVAIWEQFLKWFNRKCIVQKILRFKRKKMVNEMQYTQ